MQHEGEPKNWRALANPKEELLHPVERHDVQPSVPTLLPDSSLCVNKVLYQRTKSGGKTLAAQNGTTVNNDNVSDSAALSPT